MSQIRCDMCALQFYARGAFASPAIGWCCSKRTGLVGQFQRGLWAVSALVHSSVDWPVRRLSQGTAFIFISFIHPLMHSCIPALFGCSFHSCVANGSNRKGLVDLYIAATCLKV